MPKLIHLEELTVRRLTGANSPEDAVYYASRSYYMYEMESVAVQPFNGELSEQDRLSEVLRQMPDVDLDTIAGKKLYLVTLKLVQKVEISDANIAYINTGLDQESGLPVAGDGEDSSDGSTESRFGGPPTEA